MNKDVLRLAFSDICKGYSLLNYEGSLFYIKHITHHDQVDVESYYDSMYELAVRRGLPTEKDKLEWLDKNKVWTRADNDKLNTQRVYVDNLEKSKKNYPIKSQLDQHKKLLEEEKINLAKMIHKKNSLLGLTCELFAARRESDYYIYLSLYKDNKLLTPVFTRDEFSNLTDLELDNLSEAYTSITNRFNIQNIKKISIATFFLSYYLLCADNPTHFFGKPLCELTYNQLNLLSYAGYFNRILSSLPAVSDDIRNDPDKLEEFYAMAQKAKETISKTGDKSGGMTSFTGGTKADYDALGVKSIDMYQKIQDSKGSMSIQDIMKLTGAG